MNDAIHKDIATIDANKDESANYDAFNDTLREAMLEDAWLNAWKQAGGELTREVKAKRRELNIVRASQGLAMVKETADPRALDREQRGYVPRKVRNGLFFLRHGNARLAMRAMGWRSARNTNLAVRARGDFRARLNMSKARADGADDETQKRYKGGDLPRCLRRRGHREDHGAVMAFASCGERGGGRVGTLGCVFARGINIL